MQPSMSDAPAVALHGVTRAFGEGATRVQALRGVDLTLPAGELAMLVGPSGCGKTTLIQVIAAVLDADAGTCRVFGEDVTAMTRDARTTFRRHTIGFCFQQFQLVPTLDARENTAIPLLLQGVSRRDAFARADAELDALGLGDRLRNRPGELSGGQQQRVAIARALVHAPRLLVCDEPTSALDHATGIATIELLRARALHPGRAVLVVTHDARILSYADRVCAMDDGRVVSVATPSVATAAVTLTS